MSYEELLTTARAKYGVARVDDLQALAELLVSLQFQAMEWRPYRAMLLDEFVDERLMVAAYTLADPAYLRPRATEEESEHFAPDPSEEFDPYEYGEDNVAATTLARELEILERVVVLVEHAEGNPTAVGNFRVHGGGQWVRESLWAATGVLPRDAGAPSGDSCLFGEAFSYFGREPYESAPLP